MTWYLFTCIIDPFCKYVPYKRILNSVVPSTNLFPPSRTGKRNRRSLALGPTIIRRRSEYFAHYIIRHGRGRQSSKAYNRYYNMTRSCTKNPREKFEYSSSHRRNYKRSCIQHPHSKGSLDTEHSHVLQHCSEECLKLCFQECPSPAQECSPQENTVRQSNSVPPCDVTQGRTRSDTTNPQPEPKQPIPPDPPDPLLSKICDTISHLYRSTQPPNMLHITPLFTQVKSNGNKQCIRLSQTISGGAKQKLIPAHWILADSGSGITRIYWYRDQFAPSTEKSKFTVIKEKLNATQLVLYQVLVMSGTANKDLPMYARYMNYPNIIKSPWIPPSTTPSMFM